ncbi:hypothetical protein FPOAC1_003871 [Fusarium poae]|uniref:hypothetical protein n=1 Tax=Fusarium poae TaxID=36050 RepID=UPI001CEA00AD|nr:hypothetical protein FPOAC1_003871 [Fusarium poae]KAG8677843.1 hypothetical protein FPOAC1_003871 [Fusarium poae]
MERALPALRTVPDDDAPNVLNVAFSTVKSSDFENRRMPQQELFGKLTGEEFGVKEREMVDRWFKVFILHGAGLNHLGFPHWSELTFNTQDLGGRFRDAGDAVSRIFHTGVSKDPSYQHIIQHLPKLTMAKVFVQSPLGHPESGFMKALYTKSRARESLLIQLYGQQVPSLCSCCAERYITSPVRSGAHQIGPFHECKVLKLGGHAIGDATCGNCHLLGLHCTYSNVRYWVLDADSTDCPRTQLAGKDKARLQSFMEAEAQPEGSQTSPLERAPRITSELPGVNLSVAERQAAVARARARILEILPSDESRPSGIQTKTWVNINADA